MKLLPYNSENGFTLVEVLVALFIIALVIMGGGMFFFYGRVNIVREAHRRAAVLVASQRLEELKGADFGEINLHSHDNYHIIQSGENWLMGNAGNWYVNVWDETKGDWELQPYGGSPEYEEPVDVDNLFKDSATHPTMVTEAQWKPDVSSKDYLEVTVTVNWEDSRSNSVSSTTLIAP